MRLVPAISPESGHDERNDMLYEARQATELVKWLRKVGRQQVRQGLPFVRRRLSGLLPSMVPTPGQVTISRGPGSEVLAGYEQREGADGKKVLVVKTWGCRRTTWTAAEDRPDKYHGAISYADDAGKVLRHVRGLLALDIVTVATADPNPNAQTEVWPGTATPAAPQERVTAQPA